MDQGCHSSLKRHYPGRPPTPTIATFLIAAICDGFEDYVFVFREKGNFLGRNLFNFSFRDLVGDSD